jgi:ectoine hydroxylase-related dioxygenase (phytanoyl-CoA dioxygenase family)
MLSEQQIRNYQKDGQISVPDKLDAEFVKFAREKMESLFNHHPELGTDYVPHLIEIDNSWLDIAKSPVILDVVEQLIGSDIIVWGSALFCKQPMAGKSTPWHQDGHTWPIRPLVTVTVWIALDPANAENGCLQVIPGSHLSKELYQHVVKNDDGAVLNQVLSLSDLGNPEVRDVVLESGRFSIHDAYMVHGAEPNNSAYRRAGLTFRYMPANSYFDRELARWQVRELGVVDVSERELHLVRGQSTEARNRFTV